MSAKNRDGRSKMEDGGPKTEARGPKTEDRRPRLASTVLCALLIVAAPAVVRGQGQPVPQAPAQQPQPQKRKALEIRGQAPAPEVVTVRPREVPQFPRKIITPLLYEAVPAAPKIEYYIVLPGPLPEPRSAAQLNPAPKPF